MAEIAERAEVSKPLLYAYFESKEGLYSAFIDRIGEELRERMGAARSSSAGAEEILESAINAFFGFVERRRHGWLVLYSEVARGGPLAQQVASIRNQIVNEVRRSLEASLDEPRVGFRSPAIDALAHAVVGAGESLAIWWLWHPELEREQVADWLFGFSRAGLVQAVDAFGGH
jgi:AcrR family transcriptional regulator